MTNDDQSQLDDSFRGLMKNLNLDETQFKSYRTNFSQLSFDQLVATKHEIESQLGVLFDILANTYKTDMDTPLVVDGFPRSDIDVVGVRLVRVRIIRLRNDLKDVLGLLEQALVEKFKNSAPPPATTAAAAAAEPAQKPPFGTVTLVVSDGPAFKCGLREGDRLVSFLDVDIDTPSLDRLARILVITRNSLERRIPVVVQRARGLVTIQLVPTSNWEGRGVLGCQLKVD